MPSKAGEKENTRCPPPQSDSAIGQRQALEGESLETLSSAGSAGQTPRVKDRAAPRPKAPSAPQFRQACKAAVVFPSLRPLQNGPGDSSGPSVAKPVGPDADHLPCSVASWGARRGSLQPCVCVSLESALLNCRLPLSCPPPPAVKVRSCRSSSRGQSWPTSEQVLTVGTERVRWPSRDSWESCVKPLRGPGGGWFGGRVQCGFPPPPALPPSFLPASLLWVSPPSAVDLALLLLPRLPSDSPSPCRAPARAGDHLAQSSSGELPSRVERAPGLLGGKVL